MTLESAYHPIDKNVVKKPIMKQNYSMNSASNVKKGIPFSIIFLLCTTATFLVSCLKKQETVMVNFREKDTTKTGKRYYEDWKKMEAQTVATLKGYRQKDIPIGSYNDRTDILAILDMSRNLQSLVSICNRHLLARDL